MVALFLRVTLSQHFPSKANNGVRLQLPKLRWIIHRSLCGSTNNYSVLVSRNYQTDVDCYQFIVGQIWLPSLRIHAPLLVGKNITYTRLRLSSLRGHDGMSSSDQLAYLHRDRTLHCQPPI